MASVTTGPPRGGTRRGRQAPAGASAAGGDWVTGRGSGTVPSRPAEGIAAADNGMGSGLEEEDLCRSSGVLC